MPEPVPRAGRAEPERAGGERQRQRGDQADRARAERPHRRQHAGAGRRSAPAAHEADGRRVGEHAEQLAQPVDERLRRRARRPTHVEREREEDAGRDQAEADQVDVALLEDRQPLAPRPPRAARTGAWAARLDRVAGALLRRGSVCGRHPWRPCFDAPGRIHLPLEPQPLRISPAMSTDRAARVLVVEDDEEIAQVLQRSLRLEGYEVRIAATARRRSPRHAEYVPDLVILDLGLPKVDGIEVAKRLRGGDDVPILMLTARDAVEARVEGLDAGADDYLVKPFERQELLARLRALLRRRPPRGSRLARRRRPRAEPRHARGPARRARRSS